MTIDQLDQLKEALAAATEEVQRDHASSDADWYVLMAAQRIVQALYMKRKYPKAAA